jgi:protein-disulfide isomerase
LQKAQRKAQNKQLRLKQQQQKQKRNRILIWATAVVVVALIVVAFALKPKEAPIAIDYDQVPTLGSADAKVKLAEFGDFQCPTCRLFSLSVLPEIKKDYIDKGLVSISFLNYTIIGPDSYTAALAVQSVYHQNKDEFWKYYDVLYKNQQDENSGWATTDRLVELARNNGIQVDYDKLRSDIENKTYADEVDKQNNLAERKRFPGTPTVLLNGTRLTDNQALQADHLKAEIDKALAKAK